MTAAARRLLLHQTSHAVARARGAPRFKPHRHDKQGGDGGAFGDLAEPDRSDDGHHHQHVHVEPGLRERSPGVGKQGDSCGGDGHQVGRTADQLRMVVVHVGNQRQPLSRLGDLRREADEEARDGESARDPGPTIDIQHTASERFDVHQTYTRMLCRRLRSDHRGLRGCVERDGRLGLIQVDPGDALAPAQGLLQRAALDRTVQSQYAERHVLLRARQLA